MTAALQTHSEPRLIKFPGRPVRPGTSTTLRDYYQSELIHDLRDLAPRSLASDRNALNYWERYTDNPQLSGSSVDDLSDAVLQLRDNMLAAGLAPASVNKTWRELKAIFEAAHADGVCVGVPAIQQRRRGRVVRTRLCVESPKSQRELITEDEVTRLYAACEYATYPARQQFRAPHLWRGLLYLFWCYGARTIDFLIRLRWEHVLWSDRLLRFTAKKTNKLQGLPLTDLGIAILRGIQGRSSRVFPGFDTRGCYLKREQKWMRGYATTWKQEICARANLRAPILLKHFRERVVTKYNALHPGLGHWIAGHSVGALSMSYDLPTDQIRELIESSPVPACFQRP